MLQTVALVARPTGHATACSESYVTAKVTSYGSLAVGLESPARRMATAGPSIYSSALAHS